MKSFLLLLMFIPVISKSQEIEAPFWNESKIFFKTAKVKQLSSDRKVLSDVFKDGEVKLVCNNGRPSSITIDVPDRFYLHDGSVTQTDFKETDEYKMVTYSIKSENKIAVVNFLYNIGDTQPKSIQVAGTDDYLAKTVKKTTLILYDFK